MKAIAAGGIMIAGIGMAFMGGRDLGAALGSKPFDYQNTSISEREGFLQTEADKFARVMKSALVNPSGVSPSFSLFETKGSAGAKKIEFMVTVSGASRIRSSVFSKLKAATKENACPHYVKSNLGKNDVRMVTTFKSSKRSFGSVTYSNPGCGRYLN